MRKRRAEICGNCIGDNFLHPKPKGKTKKGRKTEENMTGEKCSAMKKRTAFEAVRRFRKILSNNGKQVAFVGNPAAAVCSQFLAVGQSNVQNQFQLLIAVQSGNVKGQTTDCLFK